MPGMMNGANWLVGLTLSTYTWVTSVADSTYLGEGSCSGKSVTRNDRYLSITGVSEGLRLKSHTHTIIQHPRGFIIRQQYAHTSRRQISSSEPTQISINPGLGDVAQMPASCSVSPMKPIFAACATPPRFSPTKSLRLKAVLKGFT